LSVYQFNAGEQHKQCALSLTNLVDSGKGEG